MLLGAQTTSGLAKTTPLKFKAWSDKLAKSFPPAQVLRLEGILALYVPQEEEVHMFYGVIHVQRASAKLRADIFRSDGLSTLLYQDSKITLVDSQISPSGSTLQARNNTMNELFVQFLKLFTGQSLNDGLLSEEKHNWTYRFENNQQFLEAKPHNSSFDLESLVIRLDQDEKINMIRLMNKKRELGFVFEVKGRGYLPAKDEIWSPTFKINAKNAQSVLQRILR